MTESISSNGSERRVARRRPMLSTFFVTIVLPEKGPFQLDLADISETGIGFFVNQHKPSIIAVEPGETVKVHFYINQRVYLPLQATIVRMQEKEDQLLVGAEFIQEKSEGYRALLAFLQLLDAIPPSVNLQ